MAGSEAARQFSKRLRREMVRAGVDHNQLGKLLGRSPRAVQDWMRGKHVPGIHTMHRIGKILGCDPAYLAYGPDDDELVSPGMAGTAA